MRHSNSVFGQQALSKFAESGSKAIMRPSLATCAHSEDTKQGTIPKVQMRAMIKRIKTSLTNWLV